MRILIVDHYYPAFLQDFYAAHPDLPAQPYARQWQALMDECFSTSNFYSTNLRALGHEATEIVPNSEPLQRRWAEENGLALPTGRSRLTLTRRRGIIPWLRWDYDNGWLYQTLRAQIRQFRPDVLYVQDMHATSPAFLREIKSGVRLIVGQIASPYAPQANFSPYDLILTSFPHFVERFRSNGLKSEYYKLGFEKSLLTKLTVGNHHSAVFVGGLSSAHSERIRFIEAVAEIRRVDFWGYGIEATLPNSPLRQSYHGNAWGLDMYNVLFNSDMALNHHINAAEQNANNMRLYEATGVGTLLLTDKKANLHTLFVPGKEVITYGSPEECAELISYYREHDKDRQAIARAGQERTLTEHTFFHRMQELTEILERLLSHSQKKNED